MTVTNFQKVAMAMAVTALLMNPCNALASDFDGNEESSVQKMSAERGVNEELYKNDSLEWILETEKIQEEVKAKLSEEICR